MAESKGEERFLINVLWNWSGVTVSLFAGLILSPYIIRKLGAEGYGLWSLVFSIVGYYGLLDLGFRSAVVRFSAHFRARGEYERINELINTTLAYFSVMSVVLLGVTFFLARDVEHFFQISPHYHEQFHWLVLIVGISISIGVTFNVLTGCVEGFQRFDLVNRIWIATFAIRYVGCAVALSLGYGLVEMGALALFSQILLGGLYFLSLRRIFPLLRFSKHLVKWSVLKETASYGIHTFVASIANQSLEQSPSLLIGHYRPTAYVGYYSLPLRLLQYAADAVSRVGLVVAPKAAELAAKGRLDVVAKLGMYSNRYCFTLYMPFAMVLLVYGPEVIRLWLKEKGPEFVMHSAPLLPILLMGAALTMAGQFNSSTILFGLGKHPKYAWGLVVEAILNLVGMIVVIPRYGIMGAALVSSLLMVLIRGTFAGWLVCRSLHFPYPRYMASIYVRPLLTAFPVLALTYFCKLRLLPGQTWTQLISVSLTAAALYFGAAYFTCLEPEHRTLLLEWTARRLKRTAPSEPGQNVRVA